VTEVAGVEFIKIELGDEKPNFLNSKNIFEVK